MIKKKFNFNMREGNILHLKGNLVILPLVQALLEILILLYCIPNEMLDVQMLKLLS